MLQRCLPAFHSRASARCVALLACVGLLAGGCITPLSEADVEDRLEAAAQPFEGLGRRRVVPIYAETSFIAKALLTEARANPESPLAKRVSRTLGVAARRQFHVVVGGPYPELSDRVLRNAFALHREKGLPGLRVVYVSALPPSGELAEAARTARAKLYHRKL
jgi:hypothetical protein